MDFMRTPVREEDDGWGGVLGSVHGPVWTIRGPATIQTVRSTVWTVQTVEPLDRSWTVDVRHWTVPGPCLDRTWSYASASGPYLDRGPCVAPWTVWSEWCLAARVCHLILYGYDSGSMYQYSLPALL